VGRPEGSCNQLPVGVRLGVIPLGRSGGRFRIVLASRAARADSCVRFDDAFPELWQECRRRWTTRFVACPSGARRRSKSSAKTWPPCATGWARTTSDRLLAH